MTEDKIQKLEQLAEWVAQRRARGQAVVHCHGVFDLLHIGHIRHLQAARRLGDSLVVTLTPDRYVNKGPHRPAFPERLRAEALASLECVDGVAVNEWPTAVETIELLRPAVYAKGVVREEGQRDFSDAIDKERAAVEAAGGRLVLTDEETYSASHLINRFVEVFPPPVRSFLADFRERHPATEVVRYLSDLRPMKALLIGEAIIDEYQFCEVMGKSGKEPVLAARHRATERYAGGILAIANHLANFCDSVDLVTALGDADSHEEFVRAGLRPNIQPRFLSIPGAPTILKRRFLDATLAVKLFEVYVMQGGDIPPDIEEQLLSLLWDRLRHYDVVVVADFGHGLLTERVRNLLCDRSRFLAVTTQTNAGNRGFNMISRYRRADFVSMGEPEVRLECRDMSGDLGTMARRVADRLGLRTLLVTRGSQGILCVDREMGLFTTPAFSIRVVDRIGAGDAVLAVTSPVVAQGAPADVVSFVGNVVGAEACMIMGNKESIDPSSLFRHVTSLLK